MNFCFAKKGASSGVTSWCGTDYGIIDEMPGRRTPDDRGPSRSLCSAWCPPCEIYLAAAFHVGALCTMAG